MGQQYANIPNSDVFINPLKETTWNASVILQTDFCFVSGLCKEEYVTYNFTDFQICVKYVSDLTTYPEAVKHCRADGGDIFRIDTALKYDIFKDLLGMIHWLSIVKNVFFLKNISQK